MFLTRSEYDWLVENFVSFMGEVWPNMQKEWSVNGVMVWEPRSRQDKQEWERMVDVIPTNLR